MMTNRRLFVAILLVYGVLFTVMIDASLSMIRCGSCLPLVVEWWFGLPR